MQGSRSAMVFAFGDGTLRGSKLTYFCLIRAMMELSAENLWWCGFRSALRKESFCWRAERHGFRPTFISEPRQNELFVMVAGQSCL